MSVRMGLLALLAEGPSHGYQLKASFEARTGGVWKVNVGQVYTTLDRLAVDGLAAPAEHEDTGDGGRDRRPWAITLTGKEALEAWFDDATIDPTPPRDELLVKVLLAFGRSRREAITVIDRQRTELFRLATAERRRRSLAPTGPDQAAALAAELMAEAIAVRREADLRWLDHCEQLISTTSDEGSQR